MIELKKCSCGGTPHLNSWEVQEDDEGNYTFDMYYVKCENCKKAIPELQFTEEDAVQIWNNYVADNLKTELENKK